MSKKFKRIISLVMAAVMLLCSGAVASVSAYEHEILDSGYCGDNLEYDVSISGVLYIYGEGDMWDFEHDYDDVPWNDYYEDITEILVDSGVTSIGDHAFWWLDEVNKLYLPSTLEYIGACSIDFDPDEYYMVIFSGTEDEWCDISYGDGYDEGCRDTFDFAAFDLYLNGEAPCVYFNGYETSYVKYGDILVLPVYFEYVPEGASLYWEAEGYGVEMEYSEYEECFYIRANDTGSVDIYIGIEYEDGRVDYFDYITVETRSNFFLMIISLFKDLFGIDRYVY